MFSAASTVMAWLGGKGLDQRRFPRESYSASIPGRGRELDCKMAPVKKTEPLGPKATASPAREDCAQSRLPALSYLARKAAPFVTLTPPKLAALVNRPDKIAWPAASTPKPSSQG